MFLFCFFIVVFAEYQLSYEIIHRQVPCDNVTRIRFNLLYGASDKIPLAAEVIRFTTNTTLELGGKQYSQNCYSYVGLGQPERNYDCATGDPDFIMNGVTFSGGWYCNDPTSPQMHPNQDSPRIFFLAQLSFLSNNIPEIFLLLRIYTFSDNELKTFDLSASTIVANLSTTVSSTDQTEPTPTIVPTTVPTTVPTSSSMNQDNILMIILIILFVIVISILLIPITMIVCRRLRMKNNAENEMNVENSNTPTSTPGVVDFN